MLDAEIAAERDRGKEGDVGKGRLVAVIEYEGRTQRVAVELTVLDPKVSRS